MSVFDPALIAPYFVWRDSVTLTNPSNAMQILTGNPSRVAVLFAAFNQTLVISPFPTAGGASGFSAAPNTQPMMLTFAQLGAVIGGEWWVGAAAAGSIYCLEVIYYPREG